MCMNVGCVYQTNVKKQNKTLAFGKFSAAVVVTLVFLPSSSMGLEACCRGNCIISHLTQGERLAPHLFAQISQTDSYLFMLCR